MSEAYAPPTDPSGLYTPAQRARRDNTVWTLVQGVLAPLQFVVFLVSLVLVLRYLSTGNAGQFLWKLRAARLQAEAAQ